MLLEPQLGSTVASIGLCGRERARGDRCGGGGTHIAVMVSLWKVTKAMPRGFSFTFSFSRL